MRKEQNSQLLKARGIYTTYYMLHMLIYAMYGIYLTYYIKSQHFTSQNIDAANFVFLLIASYSTFHLICTMVFCSHAIPLWNEQGHKF
jgi:hypothetical protein